ncbi:MAG: hypothetical protein H7Z43_06835 [Clostridia bacterium]|nr:hypothetical protein [Deltaproteobacteria bacterium]
MMVLAQAYLIAWMTVLTTVLGMLLIVLVAHALRVRWIVVVRRPAEHVATTLPWLALLFLPLLAMAHMLYPDPPEHLKTWLSLPLLAIRGGVCFAIWIGLAETIRRRTFKTPPVSVQPVAAAGLPLFAITITLASYDWLVALTPEWSSTVYGVYVFASGFVSAWALLAILAVRAAKANASHLHAVGRMLFAFVIFWTYIGFCQFFVIAMGDLPEEVRWVQLRFAPGMRWMTAALALFHFVVPFFALLSRANKRRPKILAGVAALVLVMHAVDITFLVGRLPHVFDLLMLVVMTGTTIAFGSFRARGQAPLADNDPQFAASMKYVS